MTVLSIIHIYMTALSIIHIYMTEHLLGLVQAFQENVVVLH